MPDLPALTELRPRDFTARLRARDVHGIGAARAQRHRGRRALALLAAVAVPAFAAPEDWHTFAIADAAPAATGNTASTLPMPFEQAGQSFPGSAFYYLAPLASAPLAPLAHSDADDGAGSIGPAARAIFSVGSQIDRTRSLTCLTAAIYYEAASEPDAGQRAVGQVVLNRVAHPSYPNSVCGVVYQGSERTTGCQFSFTCDGSLARVPVRFWWDRAESVARAALSGYVYAPVGLATNYHTAAIHPYWADSLNFLGQIGAHRFYRLGGRAGAAATFNASYTGIEPAARPFTRATAAIAAPGTAPDPVAIQNAYAGGLAIAHFAVPGAPLAASLVRAAPAPRYAEALAARGGETLYEGAKLPEATGIRPEYAQSGKWIAQPGS